MTEESKITSITFTKWCILHFKQWRDKWMPGAYFLLETEGMIRDTVPADARTTEELFEYWVKHKGKIIGTKKKIKPKPRYDFYCPNYLNTDSITEAERMIDDNRRQYREAIENWWKTLTEKEQRQEYKKDNNIVLYVKIPKTWRKK
jgi:hypothetical protein